MELYVGMDVSLKETSIWTCPEKVEGLLIA